MSKPYCPSVELVGLRIRSFGQAFGNPFGDITTEMTVFPNTIRFRNAVLEIVFDKESLRELALRIVAVTQGGP